MNRAPSVEALRSRARDLLGVLGGSLRADALDDAKRLVGALRDVRDYETMGRVAEAVSRLDPADATNRRLYAQCLLDTGKATVAIDLLRALIARVPPGHLEHAEATGLLGRAYKQIFLEAGDRSSAAARDALEQAIAAYRGPYEADPANTWHGVNLVALLVHAQRLGLSVAQDVDPKQVARQVVATLEATAMTSRDAWFWPTLAEASLGLGDWTVVEGYLRAYAAAPDVQAFQIASTLRQFTQVWELDKTDDRGRALVSILRARLMQLPGGTLELSPVDINRLRAEPEPDEGQLEAVLGEKGPQTFKWWRLGLERALSVACIRRKLGDRVGTGFLVRAGSIGLTPADELLVLTNFHVVNAQGAAPGIRPEEAEVVFEAVDPNVSHDVIDIVWSSPPDRHDASVLRLATAVAGIKPLPVARALPVLEDGASVYVIGHPGGRELAFSFQDNEVLDHEGPPGAPQIPGVCRLHYRAPTEGGSSGSPVFNATLWEVVGLHHKGGKLGMRRLNGKEGTYGANEGISLQSISAAIAARAQAR